MTDDADFNQEVSKLVRQLAKENTVAYKIAHNQYIVTEDIAKATHWRAEFDPDNEENKTSVTVGKVYRLYFDKYEKEEAIVDDRGNMSTIYMCHNGEFLIVHD